MVRSFDRGQSYTVYDKSATILNHIIGSRNDLSLLPESGNQVEILKPGIIFSTLFSTFPYIMNHVMHKPLFGKQE